MNWRPVVCEHMELERTAREAALLRRISALEQKLERLERVLEVDAGDRLEVEANAVEVVAPSVNVDSAMARFSGVVQCDTLIANSVVGSSYTPGAGNVM